LSNKQTLYKKKDEKIIFGTLTPCENGLLKKSTTSEKIISFAVCSIALSDENKQCLQHSKSFRVFYSFD
jgi:hypothetical protein